MFNKLASIDEDLQMWSHSSSIIAPHCSQYADAWRGLGSTENSLLGNFLFRHLFKLQEVLASKSLIGTTNQSQPSGIRRLIFVFTSGKAKATCFWTRNAWQVHQRKKSSFSIAFVKGYRVSLVKEKVCSEPFYFCWNSS